MDFTEADAETLGDKLDAMDLTEGERAALVALFAATDEEVAGFAYDLNPNEVSFKALTGKMLSASGTGNIMFETLRDEPATNTTGLISHELTHLRDG